MTFLTQISLLALFILPTTFLANGAENKFPSKINDSLQIISDLNKAYNYKYNSDSCLLYTNNALQRSIQINDQFLITKTRIQLAYYLLNANQLDKAEKIYAELSEVLQKTSNDKLKIEYNIYHAWFLGFKGQITEAINLMHENIEISKRNENYLLYRNYDFLSGIEFNAGYYDDALENKLKAREYTDKSNIETLMRIDAKLGMIYLDLGITNKAMYHYKSAIKLSEEIDNNYVDAYYGLGMCHFFNQEYDQAYHYFETAVNYATEQNVLTRYYVPINSYLHYWKCSTLLYKENHEKLGKDFIKTTSHLLQNERNPFTEILQAEIYIYYNQADKAESVIMQNLRSIEKLDASSLIADYYYWLALATEKQKKYKTSLQYYKRFQATTDSIKNIGVLSKITNLQEQYEAEKREAQISTLNDQIEYERLSNELSQSRSRVIVISLLMILLSAIVITLYRKNRHKLKLLQLETKNKEKEHEIQQILEHSKTSILQSKLQGQENERVRLAKELHDDLGSRLTALNYFVSSKKGIFKGDDETLLKTELKSVQKYVRNVSHLLARPQFSHYTLPQLIMEQKNWINGKEIDFDFYSDPAINWESIPENNQNQMYRIVQEAVTNTLKHAGATKMNINIEETTDGLKILINDNGIGIVESNVSGIGMKNMLERAVSIGGQLKIKTEYKKGTQIIFWYPYKSA